jgi:hypothetical protein
VQRLNCKVGPRIFALFLLLITVSACCGPAAELVPVYVEKTPIAVVGRYSLGRPILSGLRLYGAEHASPAAQSGTGVGVAAGVSEPLPQGVDVEESRVGASAFEKLLRSHFQIASSCAADGNTQQVDER